MSSVLSLPGLLTAEQIAAIEHPLERAIALVGISRLGRELGVTHQAIRKWQLQGRLPRTDWTGETAYGAKIEEITQGVVTVAMLREKWPKWCRPGKGGAAVDLVAFGEGGA